MALYLSRALPLVQVLLHLFVCAASRLADRATVVVNASSLNEEYDYVIVGGGTSGLTVAYRLTEDPVR